MIRPSLGNTEFIRTLRARALRMVAGRLEQRRDNVSQPRSDWRSATRLWPDFGAD